MLNENDNSELGLIIITLVLFTERRRPRQPARNQLLSEQWFCLQVLPVLQPAALLAANCIRSV